MKDPKPLQSVAEFHKTFQLPIVDKPVIPSKERCALRIALLQEELNELKEAIEENDLLEVVDAFCDIQYVLSGAILEFGVGEKFEKLFNEVHRSNMSKACDTEEDAKATQEKYMNEKGTESVVKKVGDDYLVYRSLDNKVLKSVNYSPADLQKYLDEE